MVTFSSSEEAQTGKKVEWNADARIDLKTGTTPTVHKVSDLFPFTEVFKAQAIPKWRVNQFEYAEIECCSGICHLCS